ncbi:MAG TPA: site-2 protease family protein [Anaerolineaceae bacterium]|nr:site-2 protease family protein [Anaerolineaceae bacterium]
MENIISTPSSTTTYDTLVGRYFSIESVNLGDPKRGYIVSYTGHLYSDDSQAAYDALAAQLKPLGVTPLFRKEGEKQAVILVTGRPESRPGNPLVNLVLLGATLLSVLYTGSILDLMYRNVASEDLTTLLMAGLVNILHGWPFAASLLGILLAHEFGHYLAGRAHGTNLSLPYFIPLPFPVSEFGTMGAVINMKEPPKNRRVLLDIGAAGPLAGFIVAIPILLLGLILSKVEPLPSTFVPGTGMQMEGNSIIYLLAKYVVFGQLLPAPASYGGVSPVLYWLRYIFTGHPFPLGGHDVLLHPVAWAAWAGLLVTALNLIPAGQLDGGHMLYVLFGAKKARRILPFILVALVILGFAWQGWWLWAALIFFLVGRSYAEPLDQITELDPPRKALAVAALIVFLLVFTPVPLTIIY